jgi:hypothetical protein
MYDSVTAQYLKELNEAKSALAMREKEINECHTCQRHKELIAEVAKLRKALGWYAEPRTWNQWLPDSAGDIARKALA